MLMSVLFRTTSKRSRVLVFLAVLAAGVALSVCSWVLLELRETAAVKAEFRFDAEQRIGSIQRTLAGSLEVVNSVGAYYRASEHVTPDEFRIFTEPFLSERPGIYQLAFVLKVPADERPGHEAALKQELGADYQLAEFVPETGAYRPAQTREDYFPVIACRPRLSGGLTPGLDLGSVPELRAAIDEAFRSGKPQTVRLNKILQDLEGYPPWLVMMPVRLSGGGGLAPSAAETAAAEHRQATEPDNPRADSPSGFGSLPADGPWGLAVGVFQLDKLINAALVSADEAGIALYLFDQSGHGPPRQICYATRGLP